LFKPIKTKCYQREDKIKGRPSCQHVEINIDVCPVPLIRGGSQISLEIPRADKRIKRPKRNNNYNTFHQCSGSVTF
jgi:hypothetical protein